MVTPTPQACALDIKGVDTLLAAHLHERAGIPLDGLRQALRTIREQRTSGVTLARALVEQGVLQQASAERAVEAIVAHDARVASASHDALSEVDDEAPTVAGSVLDMHSETVASSQVDARTWATHASGEYQWLPGTRLGKYLVLQQIGSGGMGKVFLGEDLETHARYAIKTLNPGADAETIQRLQREVQAQSLAGSHPNVARVVGTHHERGRMFLVMEYVSGGTLHAQLRQGALATERAAQLARGIACGLEHMHALGVLHRDIKPGNVLLDANGEPKLTDFGIAKVKGAESLTMTGDVLGTPSYMSPEQAVGERELFGPKMDVYSLGVLLFEMLTGRLPFVGSPYELLTLVVIQDAPRVRDFNPDVPEWLAELCDATLNKEPADRPTLKRFIKVLDAHLGARPSAAGPPLSVRLRGVSKPFAVFAGLGLFGLGILLGGDRDAPAPSPPPASSAPTQVVADTPLASATPAAPTRPVVWSWLPGERRRFELRTTQDMVGSQFGEDRFEFEMLTIFEQTWEAIAIEPRYTTVAVTLDRVVVRWEVKIQNEDGVWEPDPVEFDSLRGGSESPFAAAVGARFELDLDPVSGKVLLVRGAGAIQERIHEGLAPMQQRFYVIPALSSDGALRDRLNSVLHVLPPAGVEEVGTAWALPRGPLVMLGGEDRADAAGSLRRVELPTPNAKFQAARRGQSLELGWRANDRLSAETYEWAPPQVVPWLIEGVGRRELRGEARLREGRLRETSVRETWSTTREGVPTSEGQGGWKADSRGTCDIRLREFDG